MHNSVGSCRPDNSIEITFENNPINILSEHFSLAKKFAFLLYVEFETEQLKYFTQSLTTSVNLNICQLSVLVLQLFVKFFCVAVYLFFGE